MAPPTPAPGWEDLGPSACAGAAALRRVRVGEFRVFLGILGAGTAGLGNLSAPSARHKGSGAGLDPSRCLLAFLSTARDQPKFRREFNPAGNGAGGIKALPGSSDTRLLLLGKGSKLEYSSLQPSPHSGSPGKAIPAHLGGCPEAEGAGGQSCALGTAVPGTSRAPQRRELGMGFSGAQEFPGFRLWIQEEP